MSEIPDLIIYRLKKCSHPHFNQLKRKVVVSYGIFFEKLTADCSAALVWLPKLTDIIKLMVSRMFSLLLKKIWISLWVEFHFLIKTQTLQVWARLDVNPYVQLSFVKNTKTLEVSCCIHYSSNMAELLFCFLVISGNDRVAFWLGVVVLAHSQNRWWDAILTFVPSVSSFWPMARCLWL